MLSTRKRYIVINEIERQNFFENSIQKNLLGKAKRVVTGGKSSGHYLRTTPRKVSGQQVAGHYSGDWTGGGILHRATSNRSMQLADMFLWGKPYSIWYR